MLSSELPLLSHSSIRTMGENTVSTNTIINNSSSSNNKSNLKWINQLRVLPSDPKSNDFLKLDYIEVNLNNSRKLITNVNQLTNNFDKYVKDVDLQMNGNLVQLKQIKQELDWLE